MNKPKYYIKDGKFLKSELVPTGEYLGFGEEIVEVTKVELTELTADKWKEERSLVL